MENYKYIFQSHGSYEYILNYILNSHINKNTKNFECHPLFRWCTMCLLNWYSGVTYHKVVQRSQKSVVIYQTFPKHWRLVHLKNISQIGWFSQIGVKIKNLWNHHLEDSCFLTTPSNSCRWEVAMIRRFGGRPESISGAPAADVLTRFTAKTLHPRKFAESVELCPKPLRNHQGHPGFSMTCSFSEAKKNHIFPWK